MLRCQRTFNPNKWRNDEEIGLFFSRTIQGVAETWKSPPPPQMPALPGPITWNEPNCRKKYPAGWSSDPCCLFISYALFSPHIIIGNAFCGLSAVTRKPRDERDTQTASASRPIIFIDLWARCRWPHQVCFNHFITDVSLKTYLSIRYWDKRCLQLPLHSSCRLTDDSKFRGLQMFCQQTTTSQHVMPLFRPTRTEPSWIQWLLEPMSHRGCLPMETTLPFEQKMKVSAVVPWTRTEPSWIQWFLEPVSHRGCFSMQTTLVFSFRGCCPPGHTELSWIQWFLEPVSHRGRMSMETTLVLQWQATVETRQAYGWIVCVRLFVISWRRL